MSVDGRHIRSKLLFGVLAMLAVAMPGAFARAQTGLQTITTIAPPPRPIATPWRRKPVSPILKPDFSLPKPVSHPTVSPEGLGDQTSSANETAPRPMASPPVRDVASSHAVTSDEGVVPLTSPVVADRRSDAERRAVRGPPAGHNPELFAIEISPILDRRPRALYRFEPYQPTGVRAGSFIVLPEIEVGTGFYSNVFETTRAKPDITFDVRPSVRAVSNWRRHAAEFRASGILTSFRRYDTENVRAYTLEGRGRLDVTRRTNVEGLLSHDVGQEGRSSIDSVAGALEPTTVTTDNAALTVNHRFNRLRLQLRGTISDVSYGNVNTSSGTVSNRDRDVTITTGAARASWEFKPVLFAFIEAGVDDRSYKVASFSDGINRSSRGDRYRAGISFGNTDEILRGEVSLGYGRQTPDDPRLGEIEGLLVDANLAWRITRQTSLLLLALTDFTDTTVAGSPGALSRTISLGVQHKLRRNLVASASIARSVQKYEGIALTERDWTISAGLDYEISRNVALFGRYQHVAFESDDAARNYNSDEIRIGVRFRQ